MARCEAVGMCGDLWMMYWIRGKGLIRVSFDWCMGT